MHFFIIQTTRHNDATARTQRKFLHLAMDFSHHFVLSRRLALNGTIPCEMYRFQDRRIATFIKFTDEIPHILCHRILNSNDSFATNVENNFKKCPIFVDVLCATKRCSGSGCRRREIAIYKKCLLTNSMVKLWPFRKQTANTNFARASYQRKYMVNCRMPYHMTFQHVSLRLLDLFIESRCDAQLRERHRNHRALGHCMHNKYVHRSVFNVCCSMRKSWC